MSFRIRGNLTSTPLVRLALTNGSSGAPSHTFTSSTGSGFFHANGNLGISSNGGQVVHLSTPLGNVAVTGNVQVSNAISATGTTSETSLSPWTPRTSPYGYLYDIEWSPSLGLFVAVSYGTATVGGNVQTSSDGITWTAQTPASTNHWTSVAWSPSLGLFAAVSDNGSGNRVMTSTNGTTWTTRTSAGNNSWTRVIWSPENAIFVAVAQNGANCVMTSEDGVNWVARTPPASNGWYGLTWAASLGIFVAVGLSGTGRVMTSSDGITWILRNSADETKSWVDVAWSPTLRIFAAVSITNAAMTSSDGVNWTAQLLPVIATYNRIKWIPGLEKFVAVNDAGNVGRGIVVSSNGAAWSLFPQSIVYSPDYSIGYSPALQRIVLGTSTSSSDATVYKIVTAEVGVGQGSAIAPIFNVNSPATGIYSSAANALSMTTNNTRIADFSQDGLRTVGRGRAFFQSGNSWSVQTMNPGTSAYFGVTWSPALRLFVAVAYSGTNLVSTSPDGYTWTARSAANSNQWLGVAWSPSLGLFAAVSYNGSGNRVMTSPDGITWTARSSAADYAWRRIAWSPSLGLFAATAQTVGTSSIMTSSNGITWTLRTTPNVGLEGIIWAAEAGIFCAVGYSGAILTSSDGIVWTQRTSPTSNSNYDVAWSPDLQLFVVVSSDGTNRILTSPDAVVWTARAAPENNSWVCITWASDAAIFMAMANSGTNRAMFSYDGITWTLYTPAGQQWNDVVYAPELGLIVAVADTGTTYRGTTIYASIFPGAGNCDISGAVTATQQPYAYGSFPSLATGFVPMTVANSNGITVTNSSYLTVSTAGRYVFGFQSLAANSIGAATTTRYDVYMSVDGVNVVQTLNEANGTGYHFRNAATMRYLGAGSSMRVYFSGAYSYGGAWSTFWMMRVA